MGALQRNEAAAALLPPGVIGASIVAPDAVETAVTTTAEPVEVVFDGVVLRVVLVAVVPTALKVRSLKPPNPCSQNLAAFCQALRWKEEARPSFFLTPCIAP